MRLKRFESTASTMLATALIVIAVSNFASPASLNAQTSSSQDQLPNANQQPDSSGYTLTGQDMVDKAFLRRTILRGNLAIKLGQMATERSSNDSVKKIAAMSVRDHTHLNDALTSLAKAMHVDLVGPTRSQTEILDRLEKLSGTEFDNEYIKVVLGFQKDSDESFHREASYAANVDLKTIATHAAPILHAHRLRIEQWAGSVNVAEK